MRYILLSIVWSVSTLFSAELLWQKEINSAFSLAKKEQRVVMLMVESSHCVWCKKMKQRTLANVEVAKRLKPYVMLKIMRKDVKAVRGLPPKIYGVPSIFFMTPNHKIVESIVGYFGVDDFLSYMDDVEKKVPLKPRS